MNVPASKKPMTKTEMIVALAQATCLERKQVVTLFDELAKLIEKELDDGAGAVSPASIYLPVAGLNINLCHGVDGHFAPAADLVE